MTIRDTCGAIIPPPPFDDELAVDDCWNALDRAMGDEAKEAAWARKYGASLCAKLLEVFPARRDD
jgi:hypothetical protein